MEMDPGYYIVYVLCIVNAQCIEKGAGEVIRYMLLIL